MKMVKRFGFIALTLVLAVAISACGTKKAADPPPSSQPSGQKETGGDTPKPAPKDEKITLKFWALGNAGYDLLAEEYMNDHPNITIEIQEIGDQTVHHNNMITALSAGAGAPDIFMLEIAFMERFIEAKDKFYNLYDFGAKDIASNYLDWKWKQAESKDGSFMLGLPTDVGPTVAYYRVDLLEQAGLPTDPAGFAATIDTWDKFAQVASDFKAKTGKYFVDTTDLLYNALRDQAIDEIYFSKSNDSFIGESSAQVKKAYDFTVKGIQEGWVGNYAMWSPEWGQATNDGDFAVMLAPAWMTGPIKGNAEETAGKWRVTQMPEGAGNWGGSFISLPKEGKHPQEAYDFISWMLNKDQQLQTFKDKGLMPSIPSLYTDSAFTGYQDEFFGNQAIAIEFAKAAQRVNPVYYGPFHDQTDSYFKDALRNVLDLKADPQKEWDSAVQQTKELLRRS